MNNLDLRTHADHIQNEFSVKTKFIPNEELFNLLKVITSLCPKLILSGRMSLYVMDLTNIDFEKRKPDLDFSLTEPLDEYEFEQIMTLLDLEYVSSSYMLNVEMKGKLPQSTKEILNQDLIRVYDKKNNIYIDIFNNQYQNDFSFKHENLYPINFGIREKTTTPNIKSWCLMESPLIPHIIYCQHPSVTIAHKVKYAFYTNYKKNKKHYDDVIDLMVKDYTDIHKRLKLLNNTKKDFIKMIQISRETDLSLLHSEIINYAYDFVKRKS